jgi:O-antigen/teichoic acid export membrane protein
MPRLIRNASWVYAAQVLNGLLGIAFVPIAVARLGTDGYGLFAVYAVLVGYVVLAELGVGKNLLRRLAGEPSVELRVEELQVALGTYLGISLILITIVAPILTWQAPAVFPVPPAYRTALRWVVALAVADYVLGVPVAVRQTYAMSAERFDRYACFTALSGLVRYGLAFAALALAPGAVALVAALVGRRVVEWCIAPVVLPELPRTAWRPHLSIRPIARRLAEAAVLSLAQVLQLTVVLGGAFLVAWTLGLSALGIYRAVFDLVSKLWLFSSVIGLVVFPRFVAMLRAPSDRRRLTALLPNVFTASLGLFGALAMAAAAVGPAVLSAMGLKGVEYATLFVLMAGGLAFNAHTNLSWELVQAAGWYRQVVRVAAVSLASTFLVWALAWTVRPATAIGWAWLLGQVPAVMLTDTLGLRAAGGARWTPEQRLIRLVIVATTVLVAIATVAPLPRLVATTAVGVGALAVAASARSAWTVRAALV